MEVYEMDMDELCCLELILFKLVMYFRAINAIL